MIRSCISTGQTVFTDTYTGEGLVHRHCNCYCLLHTSLEGARRLSVGTHIGTGKPWHFDAGDCKLSTDALSHVGYVHLCKASAAGLINRLKECSLIMQLHSLGVKLKVKLVLWPLGIWQGAAQQLGILTLLIVTSVEPAKQMKLTANKLHVYIAE